MIDGFGRWRMLMLPRKTRFDFRGEDALQGDQDKMCEQFLFDTTLGLSMKVFDAD